MNNPFLENFIKMRQGLSDSKPAPPSSRGVGAGSRALPSPDLNVKKIVLEKPDVKVVKEYFRKRIAELEESESESE
jgi:hypothetical protein